MANVVIGTRVTTVLYGRGQGIVYKINGEQSPATVRSLAGFIQTGGRATFDIVFSNGSITKALPEAILRGVQWTISEDVATSEEIAAALAHSACEIAAKAAAKEAAEIRFNEAVEALRNDPEHARLMQGEDKSSGKLAAQNIRKELKAAFKGVTFSVRKSGYGTVRISWTDGPTAAEVEAITNKYQSGSFDSMADLYQSAASPWNVVYGGAQYVFTSRDHSEQLTQKAIDAVFSRYAELESVEKPTPQTLHQCNKVVEFNAYGLATAIWQEAHKTAA